MKKSMLILFMLVALMSLSISAFALTDGDWEFQLLDSEVTITNYLGSDKEIVIPEKIYGTTVTKIEDLGDAVRKCEAISVTLPSTVEETGVFGRQIFENTTLETVYIPEGVEKISPYAFVKCKNLKTVTVPSTLKEIGTGAFLDCEALESFEFGVNLEYIDDYSFRDSGLKSADLSECTLLDWEKMKYNGIFHWAHSLKSVKLPSNCTLLPEGFVQDCDSFENMDFNGAPVKKIGNNNFRSCEALKSIIIPTTVEEIEHDSFVEAGLVELVIPYGVTTVGNSVCNGCESLKSVFVPDTMTKIGSSFKRCPNMIIYCTSDSAMAEYCKKNEISYLTDNSVNSGITVFYNGTRISFHSYGQNPELINSRTLVPLRSIFEAMGAEVEWKGETSTVVATRDGVTVTLQIGSSSMSVGNKNVTMDTPPMLLDGRTMVPVRVIAEAFGADVQWNSAGKTVLITE